MDKDTIQSALAAIPTGDFAATSKALLAALGYQSERTLELSGTVDDFIDDFPALNPNTTTERAFRNAAASVQLLFQLTSEEIAGDTQQTLDLGDTFLQEGWADSFLFFSVVLKDKNYSRSMYAEFTREINKRLLTPTVVLFRVADRLTIAFVGCRQHQYDENRQPVACQIAKLRFFISLAIEQAPNRSAANFGIKPLPNLETRFVAADTLIGLEITETRELLQDDTVLSLLKEIEAIREKYFLANNRQQKLDLEDREDECREQLKTELEQLRVRWMEGQEREIKRRIAQLPTAKQRQQLREKEEKAYNGRKATFDASFGDARKIATWKPYDQNAKADWFDPEWMFGVAKGFDAVIGNPPYIQLQKAGGRLGRLYAPCNFESFIRTGDIYCLFYEKANQLLKDNGHVCFITSNKWMRAAYGKKLRDYFIARTQPVQLLDMGPDVFDATVDTNILLFQNAASDVPTAFRAATLRTDFDKQTDNISRYLNDNGVAMEIPVKGEP